jgi:hypothetical protein
LVIALFLSRYALLLRSAALHSWGTGRDWMASRNKHTASLHYPDLQPVPYQSVVAVPRP